VQPPFPRFERFPLAPPSSRAAILFDRAASAQSGWTNPRTRCGRRRVESFTPLRSGGAVWPPFGRIARSITPFSPQKTNQEHIPAQLAVSRGCHLAEGRLEAVSARLPLSFARSTPKDKHFSEVCDENRWRGTNLFEYQTKKRTHRLYRQQRPISGALKDDFSG
jgi:hypothetical protein